MTVCAVAFTYAIACRIFTIFSSVCWHRIFLAALKLQRGLTNVTYFNFEAILTQIL